MCKLSIELVPQTCWFSNVRDHVDGKIWDILRKDTYKKANYKCEICGGVGEKHPVECHEIWHYDDEKYIQKLIGLTALCPSCHQVKHIGLARVRGKEAEAKKHLAKVNNWSNLEVEKYLTTVWSQWQKRSQNNWKLDLSWLENNFNIKVAEKR
ncbi:HNH endonuclease [Geminocystis sp.]|uniref:HNH endonuclease n=1 Tax=Geminocystis sp. TaxID=2664100 RepID=UPI0035944B21